MEQTQFSKKLIRSKSGLRIVVTDDNFQSPFLLCEPSWIPDSESPCCTECKTKFDFITRRHHCRRCGKIYCKNCCDFRMGLPRMCFVDPVRMCEGCADITRKENDFFERDLKTLINGASFQLSLNDNEDNSDATQFMCKLSSDHRLLTFDGGATGRWEPVELTQITELSVLKSPENPLGDLDWSGLFLSYKDQQGVVRELLLQAAPDSNRRQAISWLSAIQQGFKLATECRDQN